MGDIEDKVDRLLSGHRLERTRKRIRMKKTGVPIGTILMVVFLAAVLGSGAIYSFFVNTPIAVTSASQLFFDGVGYENTTTSAWQLVNATPNNEYEQSHTLMLNVNAQGNYTVDFQITNDPEIEVLVLSVSGNPASSITSLTLAPGVISTVYYYVKVLDKVTQDSYTASITID